MTINLNKSTLYWNDGDGWRFKTFNDEKGQYYFNDIPSDSLLDAMVFSLTQHSEFEIDEIW